MQPAMQRCRTLLRPVGAIPAVGTRRLSLSAGRNPAGERTSRGNGAPRPPLAAPRRRRLASSSSSAPFYGEPLPPSSRYQEKDASSSNDEHLLPPLSPLQRLITLAHSSVTALSDPTRADAVAAVGEVTGSFALSRMKAGMEEDEAGRRILIERPVVDETVAERAFELLRLHEERVSASASGNGEEGITFGAAYGRFLKEHGFDPNERDQVRFVSDPDLSYVMTRYRQCHDYWHALTGLPPTVVGELGLKWLELMQTGLPLAALSATGGALGARGLGSKEREVLWEVYLPWAVRVGASMREHSLMCTYYEEEMETDLGELRRRMGIEAAPPVEL